ncbi:hypothetical protein N658DRAFT_495343 [Parathielavia hyrcaniae]|uniref:Uncharacterized protein n=1 Tax=Parathielavia hyrcaniae TaxID=113614 RepID=A0AAN6Q807_9PEZI|nr:hypothetical protein N658DRAFT_495343 [Parathielavia hyrcaniae]
MEIASEHGKGPGKEKEGEEDVATFELQVSSVGISTNGFGDFSKCSVVTDLIHEEDLIALGDTMQGIWDSFIHQPQTGRFLVFAIILGRLCESMTREYRQIIKRLFKDLDLDKMFVSLPSGEFGSDGLTCDAVIHLPR